MTYLEFQFTCDPVNPAVDILIAELAELGFESFVETKKGLLAYIVKNKEVPDLKELFLLQNPNFQIEWSVKEIPQQNWNEKWEENFHPITIDKQCRVRAPFHAIEDVDFDIVIEPKMSFGTGHHETTYMMLKLLLNEEVSGKKVLDMGCGTGVLAILAEMLGAKSIDAIDIDEWSYENSIENAQRNSCNVINVELGDADLILNREYDLILANINRNILLNDISKYVSCLENQGTLFLSGFYLSDLDMISAKCRQYGLEFEKNISKNHWVAAKYVH